MTQALTLTELLAGAPAGNVALAAPERAPLRHGELKDRIATAGAALNRFGIGRAERVAMVLPNGPEAAAAFLAVATCAIAAPLNPAYREDEFDFFLGDLKARALLIEAGMESPARAVAARRGIAIVELVPKRDAGAGAFDLARANPPATNPTAAVTARPAKPDDVALVLHTSGTTSRPKLVPLTQANVAVSAGNVAGTLRLSGLDRCLNVMPLFHIHGLIGVLLSSMSVGAGVCCTPGFNALKFFGWLAESDATWYSAVPTMHQAILARAERNRELLDRLHLRFIRSSSASLPPQVLAGLEQAFGCPTIESYGMTEAAHQMTSNALPPGQRKPGSVGLPAGPKVAVLDADGRVLAQGEIGEVAIRGANVTAGYENNPAANAAAFHDGWFRTGDQGRFDEDGYLVITGRLKELINRGGEKISPREVDEVLLDHPAVAEAVTFALPHDKLGEEVAAAVVLKAGAQTDERILRAFAATRLAAFKVPRRIVFVAEMPKGPTGKPQRIGMAARLELAS